MIPPFFGVNGFVNPRMCHVKAYTLPEGTGYCVCRVYPAVGIQYLLWYVFAMDAVNGVAHILLGWHNQWKGEHARRGHRVVQPEHPRVDVHMGDTEQATKLAKDVQHGVGKVVATLVGSAGILYFFQGSYAWFHNNDCCRFIIIGSISSSFFNISC